MQHSHEKVKLGIVGLGHIGRKYAELLLNQEVSCAELFAVCTSQPQWMQQRASDVKIVQAVEAMLSFSELDGVIICTPHKQHVEAAWHAISAGIPVLVEKPIAAVLSDAENLCRYAEKRDVLCGVFFNQRFNPLYKKVKELLEQNCLGQITRFEWTMTEWYRAQAYYDSADWRGSWQGEGGGVLLNQCSHHLDLLQWWFGMPQELSALCCFGKYHDIEVEDEATVLFRYSQGMTGSFMASTGEMCGINRLEISGQKGRIEVMDNQIVLRNIPGGQGISDSLQTTDAEVGQVVHIPVEKRTINTHAAVLADFVSAVCGKSSALVAGTEACQSLMLANAALASSLRKCSIQMPLDAAEYDTVYTQLVSASGR